MEQTVALQQVRQTMHAICGSRRHLLKVVLGGKAHWKAISRRAFKGMPVDEETLERMWAYFVHQAGPGDLKHLKSELGLLLEQQEAEQATHDAATDIERWDGAIMDPMGKPH
jgi:hypothetical protein